VLGIARLNRGTWDEQLMFVFEVFDADQSGSVSRAELKSLLNSLPMELLHENAPKHAFSPRVKTQEALAGGGPSFEEEASVGAGFLTEVDKFTNNDLVEQAFRDCDFDHNDTLSLDQFKTWVLQYPIILNIMQSVLPYAGTPTPHDNHKHHKHHHSLAFRGGGAQNKHERESDRLAALPFHRVQSYSSVASAGSRGRRSFGDLASVFASNQSNHSSNHASDALPPHPGTSRSPPPFHGRGGQQHGGGIAIGNDAHDQLGATFSDSGDDAHTPGNGGDGRSLRWAANASGRPAADGVNPYALRAQFLDTGAHEGDCPLDLSRISITANARATSEPPPIDGMGSPEMSSPLDSTRARRLAAHRPQRSGSLNGIDLRGIDNEHQVRNLVQQARNLTRLPGVRTALTEAIHMLEEYESEMAQGDGPLDGVQKEGFLYKRGQHLHIWKQRWYLLSNNMLYYYAHKSDVRSRGVIFLTGCVVERLADDRDSHGYFGLEILSTMGNFRRVLYSTSEAQRDAWIHALQHAAQVIPIEEDYDLGSEIGKGRFSHVLNCVNKHTGEQFAVKVIAKDVMELDERELLRTEIAIMKLVNHPHIIRMEAVYEDKEKIYIVMEKLEGGELFSRIVGRPTFSEPEAFKVIKPLVESVAYLHDMGVVHRDLKPENILCGEELEDLKIADFGLSKLVLPTDVMKMPCGTLSYVAPEVLTLTGYGKETDVWSVGVIMFLLLRGKLPFDGEDREDIIDQTIHANLRELMRGDIKWSRLSGEAQDLMYQMLEKEPSRRISARAILRHPWMERWRHSPPSSNAGS